METKTCKRCGEDKPVVKFNVCKSMPQGRQNICRKCSVSPEATKRSESNKYEKHREKILERNKQYKEKNREKWLAYGRDYYEQNKGKCQAVQKIRYEANKEVISIQHKKYKEKRLKENPEILKQWARNYRKKNKEKLIEMQKKRRKINRERYRELSKIYRARRRANEYKAEGDFHFEQWFKLLEMCGNECACCKTSTEKLTVDHIIPFIMGGSNYIWNIQPLCLTCNCEKAKKAIDFRNKTVRQKFQLSS